MTTFTANSIVIDPPQDARDAQDARADRLGSAVVRSLHRAPRQPPAWRLATTLVAGVTSFGLLPLLSLPRRFLAHARIENEQLWYARQWLTRMTRGDDATRSAPPDYPPPVEARVAVLNYTARAIALVMVIALAAFVMVNPGSWPDVLGSTWGPWGVAPWIGAKMHAGFFAFWCGAAFTGYAAHVAAIMLHASTTRSRLSELNAIFADQEWFAPIRMPFEEELAWQPIVVASFLGLALLASGAVWALPMMLASGVHSRYTSVGGRHVRRALRYRVRLALARDAGRQSGARVDVPPYLLYRCAACGAGVPSHLLACPQCGAPVHAESPAALVRA